jgi:hypothetical protein
MAPQDTAGTVVLHPGAIKGSRSAKEPPVRHPSTTAALRRVESKPPSLGYQLGSASTKPNAQRDWNELQVPTTQSGIKYVVEPAFNE